MTPSPVPGTIGGAPARSPATCWCAPEAITADTRATPRNDDTSTATQCRAARSGRCGAATSCISKIAHEFPQCNENKRRNELLPSSLSGTASSKLCSTSDLACKCSAAASGSVLRKSDGAVSAHPAEWKAGELASLRTEGTRGETRGVKHIMHIHACVSMRARCFHHVIFRLQSGTLNLADELHGAQVCHRARPCAGSVHFRPSLYAARCAASLQLMFASWFESDMRWRSSQAFCCGEVAPRPRACVKFHAPAWLCN